MDNLDNKNPSETARLEKGHLKTGNAKYNILNHMRLGNSLTSREAFIEMGTTCLNTHIGSNLIFHFEVFSLQVLLL